jgi:hypothetical protein
MTEDLFLIHGFSHIEFEAGVRFDPGREVQRHVSPDLTPWQTARRRVPE